MDIPDAIAPITAYRLWNVAPDGSLRSVTAPDPWLGPEWMSAACRNGPFTDPHPVPMEGCTCGFYAFADLTPAMTFHPQWRALPEERKRMVLGAVELAGKVIEHDIGYRAERARITEIIPLEGCEWDSVTCGLRLGVAVGEPLWEREGWRAPRISIARPRQVSPNGWAWAIFVRVDNPPGLVPVPPSYNVTSIVLPYGLMPTRVQAIPRRALHRARGARSPRARPVPGWA